MNLFLYNLGIRLYRFAIGVASLFLPKAAKWVKGRRGWKRRYALKFNKKGKLFWMHVSSLGEFEQGRTVLEKFRAQNPDWQIVVTFFSPSGYEVRKTYPLADFVCYLPLDTPRNARFFLNIFQPDIAVFVKYDFWYHFITELQTREIPCYLVAGLFRKDQRFFKPNGHFWLEMLRSFTHLYVQNESSKELLLEHDINQVTVAGDTRIDRVLYLAGSAQENEIAGNFVRGAEKVIIAGSSWPAEEALLAKALKNKAFENYKVIIAPHEPSERHVNNLMKRFDSEAIRYSQASAMKPEHRVMIIDNVGMLSSLYQYGSIAIIGGGFGKGIHNILEPAAFGLPVLFGPNYKKFEEALALSDAGGAFPMEDADEMENILLSLQDEKVHQQATEAIQDYLEANKGGTKMIVMAISEELIPKEL